MVAIAPMFLLFNGFWMIDNKAIFDNTWVYRMKTIEHMKSNHFFEGFCVTHSTPIFVFMAFSIGLKLITSIVPEETLSRLGFSLTNEEISVDEDLPSFFDAIKLRHAREILSEFYNIKNRYGLEIEDIDVINKLEKIKFPERCIQGSPWYSILANHDYVERFNYISAMVPDRTAYIKDLNEDKNVQSDFCVLLLNLSAIPDEIVQQFHSGINGSEF